MPMTMERSKKKNTRANSNKATIVVGKMVDTSADELENLITDEKNHALMVIKKAINLLKKNGITAISQLKELYNTYGETYTVKKLSELPRFGKKMAEDILTNAVCYSYPKGYIPKKVSLPDWILDNDLKEADNIILKDLEKVYEVSNNEEAHEEENKVSDTENIDIESYADNLIEEGELCNIFLSILFDLFEEGSNITPERVNPNNSYDQLQVLYTDRSIFINKDLCFELFMTKCSTVKTIKNLTALSMWYYILDNCKAIYRTQKNGKTYCWARKPRTLGAENKINYIEVDIAEAEILLNRSLNITSAEDLHNIMTDLNFSIPSFSAEHKESMAPATNDFYIIPVKCKRNNFEFEIMRLNNRLDFDTYTNKGMSVSKGVYSFNQNNIKEGELLIGRDYTDQEYMEIKQLVFSFLSK